MFKNLANMASMMKQAGELQNKMGEMQEKLGHVRVEGSAGGGMVIVEASGHQQITGCRIDASLLTNPDAEMLEELVVAATNAALVKAKKAAAEQMAELTGDMNIPGLQDALGKMGMGN